MLQKLLFFSCKVEFIELEYWRTPITSRAISSIRWKIPWARFRLDHWSLGALKDCCCVRTLQYPKVNCYAHVVRVCQPPSQLKREEEEVTCIHLKNFKGFLWSVEASATKVRSPLGILSENWKHRSSSVSHLGPQPIHTKMGNTASSSLTRTIQATKRDRGPLILQISPESQRPGLLLPHSFCLYPTFLKI